MKMSASDSPKDEVCSGGGTLQKKYPDYCRTISFTDNNGVVRELVFPKALDLDRPKRARTTFSREQLDRLEAEFTGNQYLVGRERSQLARNLGLSETQVKVWFQNRRTKHKRDKEKLAEHEEAKAESAATQNLLHFLQPPPGTGLVSNDAPPPLAPPPPTSSSSTSTSSFSACHNNGTNRQASPCESPQTSVHVHSQHPRNIGHLQLTDQPPPGNLPGFATAAVTGLMAAPMSSFSSASAAPVQLQRDHLLTARHKLVARAKDAAAAALCSSSLISGHPLTELSVEAMRGSRGGGAFLPSESIGGGSQHHQATATATAPAATIHSAPAAAAAPSMLPTTPSSLLPPSLRCAAPATSSSAALRYVSSSASPSTAVESSITSGVPPQSMVVGAPVLPTDLARSFFIPGTEGRGGRRQGIRAASHSCGPVAGYHHHLHHHHHGGVTGLSNGVSAASATAAAWLVDPFSMAAACQSAQGTLGVGVGAGTGAAALHMRFPPAAWPVFPHHHVPQSLQ